MWCVQTLGLLQLLIEYLTIKKIESLLQLNPTRGTARIKEKKSITTNVSYNIPLNMKMPGGMEANKYNQVKEAFEKHKVHLQISVNSIK